MLVSSGEGQKEALQAVLGSALFARNPRLTALLEYLCSRVFDRNCGSIKEYDIATDVFHRSTTFDQTTDAIVRVEMHRLRKKLKEYYAGEGANQPLEIVLQAGRYLPEFVPRAIRIEDQPAFQAVTVVTDARGREQALQARPAAELRKRLHDPIEKTPPGVRPRRSWLYSGIILLFVILAGSGLALYRNEKEDRTTPTALPSAKFDQWTAVAPAGEAVRILCGYDGAPQRDREGNMWGPDNFFSGGTPAHVQPDRPVYRTNDPFLYQHLRAGLFTYKIPLKAGTYELRLHFMDPDYRTGTEMEGGENVRVFSVWLNEAPLLRDLDVNGDAGPDTALVRVFKDVSPERDGYLHLSFSKRLGNPLLNAIEIRPALPHRMNPIRLSAQDRAFTDNTGMTWSPDNFFLRGRTIARFGTVAGPLDAHIYERERYGNFSYAIPVAPGLYRLTLHFSESFWGPAGEGGGGIGSRIFDVYCNGRALLENFDMFQEGGTNRQITKQFPDLTPNAQGNLLLTFVPRKNYANVSAIQVEDEGK